MKLRIILVWAAALTVITLSNITGLIIPQAVASDPDTSVLDRSELQIKITASGVSAIFRLYDTAAAHELYRQLPLRTRLTNSRDAQWMFYPPQKLSVRASEAYHNGKKGELSYYAPWGDVFMLYKNFYAQDEMHRLGITLSGAENIASMSGQATIEKYSKKDNPIMKIKVTPKGVSTVFELNDSKAAQALYTQLPLTIKVEDYASNEKIYYPPEKLSIEATPKANAEAGTLAYYAPWGDVVMFYRKFGSASGLYELGKATEGSDNIKNLSRTVTIEKF